ncbi:MAG: BON domain-containing protein [Candidatus Binataceae bacterium]
MTGQDADQGVPKIECPVCGGKAEPGEVICNFCGTRLVPDTGVISSSSARPPADAAQKTSSPESFVPAHDRLSTAEFGAGMPRDRRQGADDDSSGGRGFIGIVGYTVAAIIALAAGAWLALYLTERHPVAPPTVQASPSASPAAVAVNGPTVQLAGTIPLQITGMSAAAPERGADAMRKAFNDNNAAMLDSYRHALEGDSSLHDGMVARIHIMPDGTVSAGTVRVSTSPNPGLDAEVIKEMSGWTFAPVSGGGPVEADFPIIFANKPADAATVASDLGTKLASLSPAETPEYSLGTAPSPVAAVPTPAEAALPPPAAPSRPRPLSHELASTKPRPRHAMPPLLDRVTDQLHADKKFRRVQAYTNGGTVTLFGKVFDDKDKLGATRMAQGVGGVTSVINNITTDTAQWAQYQSQIQSRLRNAGLNGVTVKVIGKDAYLDGEVKTALDKERAVTIAQAAAPVTVRTNLIRIATGSVFGF